MSEWISSGDAAELLGISRASVLRSLQDETKRAAEWGAEGEGWRYKPLVGRKIYQVRRATVERKARGA